MSAVLAEPSRLATMALRETQRPPSAPPGVSRPGGPGTDDAGPDRTAVARGRRRTRGREALIFLAFTIPNLALIGLFTYRPLFNNVYYSLLQWNLGSPTARFVGLDNYVNWFTDPHSWNYLRITVIFTVATVGGTIAVGLLVATVLNQRLHGRGFARAVVFAPYVLSGVAVGLVWMFMFDPQFGVIAPVIRAVGIDPPNWYNQPGWALAMVIIVYVWKHLGYAAVVYLAGLQIIPRELHEAAALDGAGPWRTFRSITLPLLSPMTFFLLVTVTLSSMSAQSFELIHSMTRGGPVDGTTTLMYQIYREGFVAGRAGYSATVATILFVILLGVTLLQMRFLERKVHYS
ncbi:carbohydrate ABC transporter permease [Phytoactinopolyspora limicola]|uniref:carbohydrate ABC transporter permease n=1 Tax=Phytoactinopolyspora limicola TaxID=2715536 RepID=UPI001A9CA83B|nr:sugar ABC transporter permease [Phytoactinopolyspora limicola]